MAFDRKKAIRTAAIVGVAVLGIGTAWYLLRGRHVNNHNVGVTQGAEPTGRATKVPDTQENNDSNLENRASGNVGFSYDVRCVDESGRELPMRKILSGGDFSYAPLSVSAGLAYTCRAANDGERIVKAGNFSYAASPSAHTAGRVYLLSGDVYDDDVVRFILRDRGVYNLDVGLGRTGSNRVRKTRKLELRVGVRDEPVPEAPGFLPRRESLFYDNTLSGGR